jgi:NodT family efflux transporter outer membrane factor (OMF) lipoprotein
MRKESSSFLKKRTKKLLRLGRTLPEKPATATQKSFASFLQKRRPSLAFAFLLSACTAGPDFHPPAPPTATGYLGARETAAANFGDGPSLRWWEAFGSPVLNRLVDQAMARNESLAASTATLGRARAEVAAAVGQLYPQIDGNVRAEREEVNLSAYGFDPASIPGFAGNPLFDLYTVGGGVNFDADVFGAKRRRVEQLRAQAQSRLHQSEAAHLTIAGRVTTQVLTIAAIRARIATTQTLLDEDQKLADFTETRRKAGEGTLVEVLNTQSQLADDRGDVPQLEQQLDEARHMLATLLGLAPAELGPTDIDFAQLTLPHDIPVTLPSRLVRKRPDILQAEADLHAATAEIGIATAALYPDITLGGTIGTAAPAVASLFSTSFRSFDLFAGVTAPIFHGGTLRAERKAAVEDAQASAAQYRQTVLDSFQQVADLLDALGHDQRSVDNQRDAASTARRNRDLSQQSFEEGEIGILSVLDAERLHQRAQLALVDARRRQYLDIARLFVATAGGWSGAKDVAAR